MEATPPFVSIHLLLPDGRSVLQRRTQDAPFGAGLLGLFGGGVEYGETPDQGILREVTEETSLKPGEIGIEFVAEFALPASSEFPQGRHFHLFKGRVASLEFAVYEGVRAEAYYRGELASRDDLVSSAHHLFQVIPELLE